MCIQINNLNYIVFATHENDVDIIFGPIVMVTYSFIDPNLLGYNIIVKEVA